MTSAEEQKVIDMLKAGQQPTNEDLGQALLAVANERRALQKITSDMGGTLAQLVMAHLANDQNRMSEIISGFMEGHVKLIPAEVPANNVH